MEAYQKTEPATKPARDLILLKAILAAFGGALIGGILSMDGLEKLGVLLLYPVVTALAAEVACTAGRRQTGVMLTVLSLVPSVVSAIAARSGGVIPTVAAALAVPLGALLLALIQRQKLGGFLSCAVVSASLILVLYASLCLDGIVSGKGAFAALQAWFKEGMVDPLKSVADAYIAEGLDTDGLVAGLLAEVETIPELVPSLATGLICYNGCFVGTGTVLLFFAFTRKHREELGIRAPGRFATWSMPKSVTLPIILLYIAATIMAYAGMSNGYAIYYTVQYLFLLPFTLQGLAMVDYLLSFIKKRRTLVRVLVFVGIGLLYQLVMQVLMYIGLFEQLFRVRERRRRASV